ncbi:MAG: hypothetical protein ACI9HK_005118 [Pirellulaceae bacterium]|jgi:hypothetical protein
MNEYDNAFALVAVSLVSGHVPANNRGAGLAGESYGFAEQIRW